MPEVIKRVRSTKTRDKRWLQFMRTITAEWARCVREQGDHAATHRALSERINALDILTSYRADLHARNWGARDLVESLYAEWALYLDGKRTTPGERTELYADDRWRDLRGRFVWRGTEKPFRDNSEPALLRDTTKES